MTLAPIANGCPLSSHLWWLKRQEEYYPEEHEAPEPSKPIWAFSKPLIASRIPSLPLSPGEPGPCPASWNLGHFSHSHAGLAHMVRENAVMRYFFFLFILLDKLIISSLSYWGSRSSTVLCLPLPSHPLPTPRILKVPPFPLPHTPMLCHCSPDKRPSGSSHVGPETLIKVGCRHAVCPFIILFSANTRTEREARINSQTDTKQRDRDSNLEASHQKDGVREGECPKWQGP